MFDSIKKYFKKQVTHTFQIVEVMPRAWYEKKDGIGGFRVTAEITQTTVHRGKTKVVKMLETFNNYRHSNYVDQRRGNFMYDANRRCYPECTMDDGNYDGWELMPIWRRCEENPFFNYTTQDFQKIVDDWLVKQGIVLKGSWKC